MLMVKLPVGVEVAWVATALVAVVLPIVVNPAGNSNVETKVNCCKFTSIRMWLIFIYEQKSLSLLMCYVDCGRLL
ncbi:hypothetical protein BJV82DRAFT_612656 [Fennellomyces sp. T-0311]|nr:hypothetical protein BJV82DRAFT_612656 [Fennellomyces sp. T-0311]